MLESDRADLIAQFNDVLVQVDAARLSINLLGAIDRDTIRLYGQGLDQGNSFDQVKGEAVKSRALLKSAQQKTMELEQRIGSVALKPDEERLYKMIQQFGEASDVELDLSRLMASAANQFNRQELWGLLASLYDKRRLRVKLAPVSGE